jgi:hypothetical protein
MLLLNSTLSLHFDQTCADRDADSPARMCFFIKSSYCGRTNLIGIMFEERLMAADQGLITLLRPVLLAGKLCQF